MQRVMDYLPEISFEEANYLEKTCQKLNDEEMQRFAFMYRGRRRDPLLILVCTILGFFGFAGIQRFITDSILLGILYFFTAGLCLIGTIADIINYRRITLDYNLNIAEEILHYSFNDNQKKSSEGIDLSKD